MPLTFFENYSSIKQQINILSNHIKKIGTGNLHYYHEHFNILAAEILQKDGKLLTFQHGGGITTSHSLLREYKDKEYASKTYYFNDKNGLGSHYYYEKKISLEEIEKRRFVLILNTAVCFNRWFTLKEPNHPQLEPSQLFFSKLEKSVKKKVLVKLFTQEESFEVKKMWTKKFSNKIKFLPFFSDAKKKRYYDAKIVILNEISTPLFDVIYLGLPFILIYNPINYIGYKNIFKKKLKNLKKINLVFDNPTKGANFINSLLNKNEFALWWKKVSKTKIFLDFKKYIIIENKNYLPMLIKDLNRT